MLRAAMRLRYFVTMICYIILDPGYDQEVDVGQMPGVILTAQSATAFWNSFSCNDILVKLLQLDLCEWKT